MKFIWFLYYSVFYDNQQNKYGGNSNKEGIKAIVLGFGPGVGILILGALHKIGLWQLLLDSWPYDYGRAHSKNFAAPTGVLGIAILILVYFSAKKYFSNCKRLESINACFNHTKGNLLALKLSLLPYGMIFFNAFMGVMFVGSFWIAFSLCCIAYGLAEWWTRTNICLDSVGSVSQ